MESNRKRSRGLIKGKLFPFYREAKPCATLHYTSSINNVKPNQSSPSTASVGFRVHHQDYFITHQPKPKVSFLVPATASGAANNINNCRDRDGDGDRDNVGQLNEDDESVDLRAATYIACVQERFKLERINSEKIKYHQQK
ncbi:Dynein heavy chain 1, axonemal [Quillaja saponaria]|uniref:Dynein heavy chain 1, axonemal n=1 Tax=Quillaja saponaria TaxID=32244 RepID=A0AAD7PYW2_QUISA|nr:Dynein heavy chain 1, axonemal [Quillaja saponaria]